MEEIAEVIDDLENIIAAMSMQLHPALHLKALRESLPALRERLMSVYLAAGGEDVWSD